MVQMCKCLYFRNCTKKIAKIYVILCQLNGSYCGKKVIANYVTLCLSYTGLYFGIIGQI